MKKPASTAALERASSTTSMIDVLDHCLDKGIVIDAWMRVSFTGIDLFTVQTRVFVASIETYLKYGNAIAFSPLVAHLGDRPLEAALEHPILAH
jgi:gas vesicle structural protein